VLQVLEAFARAERKKKPSPVIMFDDVYDELPSQIRRQREEMKQHIMQYGGHYPVDSFEPLD